MLVQAKEDSNSLIGVFIYRTQYYSCFGGNGTANYGKTDWSTPSKISWYSISGTQFNESNTQYCYVLLSTDKIAPFEITFTTNTTYTVPVTRNYLLELYGVGGGSYGSGYQGGSSCQRYDSISLTKGTSITIKIAKWNSPSESAVTIIEPTTKFRSYTVENAGKYGSRLSWGTNYYEPVAGTKGTGNLGTDGTTEDNSINASLGKLGSTYGYGSQKGYSYFGANGAIYLKYLG